MSNGDNVSRDIMNFRGKPSSRAGDTTGVKSDAVSGTDLYPLSALLKGDEVKFAHALVEVQAEEGHLSQRLYWDFLVNGYNAQTEK